MFDYIKPFLRLGACVCAMSVGPHSAGAATLGIDVTSDDNLTATTGGQNTYGYAFSLSQEVEVTGLGMFDYGADGVTITGDPQIRPVVGLWDSGGSLITSALIHNDGFGSRAVTSASNDGDWLISDVSETLAAGTYVIAANMSDQFLQQVTISTVSYMTYLGSRAEFSGSDLAFPNDQIGLSPGSYFGPTIEFASTAAVPLPGALALFAGALGGLGLLGWRRRPVAC